MKMFEDLVLTIAYVLLVGLIIFGVIGVTSLVK